MRDQIDFISAEERRLSLVLFHCVYIGANLIEDLLKDKVAEWFGRHDHEDQNQHDSYKRHKSHNEEQECEIIKVAL